MPVMIAAAAEEEAKWAGRPFFIAVQRPAGDCILSDSHPVQHIDIWEAVTILCSLAILSRTRDGFFVECCPSKPSKFSLQPLTRPRAGRLLEQAAWTLPFPALAEIAICPPLSSSLFPILPSRTWALCFS